MLIWLFRAHAKYDTIKNIKKIGNKMKLIKNDKSLNEVLLKSQSTLGC